MNTKQLFVGLFLQVFGIKKLWQFKLLFKYFPESSKCNIDHEFFGTKYKCWFYEYWTLCIETKGKLIWWQIDRFDQLPPLHQQIRNGKTRS